MRGFFDKLFSDKKRWEGVWKFFFIETLQLLVKREISDGKEKSSYLVKWISIALVD